MWLPLWRAHFKLYKDATGHFSNIVIELYNQPVNTQEINETRSDQPPCITSHLKLRKKVVTTETTEELYRDSGELTSFNYADTL